MSGGSSERHTSTAAGHRAANAQPGGSADGSGGIPEIWGRRRRRTAIDGMLAPRPRGIGVPGVAQEARHGRLFCDPPRVEHDRPLAQLLDDTQVMRDEQQRHAAVADDRPQQLQGSGPGP